jgi:hypothetical protein
MKLSIDTYKSIKNTYFKKLIVLRILKTPYVYFLKLFIFMTIFIDIFAAYLTIISQIHGEQYV